MQTCPRCQQTVEAQAVRCPYCRTSLKAYGHPGIPLHRATEDDFLCSSCTYHADNTCNFPQRPYAKDCTLYHNIDEPLVETPVVPYQASPFSRLWFKRNQTWIVLLGLVAISLLLALS